MSEANASETQNSTGSAGENQETQTSTKNVATEETSSKEEMMPRVKYLELLDEKKKTAAKLKEFQDKEKLEREKALAAQGEFKQLLEEREKEIQKLAAENEDFKTSRKNAQKMRAFLKTVGTELDDKWLGLIDVEKISFKPESDDVDPMTVNAAVDSFKKLWPEALKAKDGKFPTHAPNGSLTISESEWNKLPAKDMKKYKLDQIQWGK